MTDVVLVPRRTNRCGRENCRHPWECHEEPFPLPSDFEPGTWCGAIDGDVEVCACEAWVEP